MPLPLQACNQVLPACPGTPLEYHASISPKGASFPVFLGTASAYHACLCPYCFACSPLPCPPALPGLALLRYRGGSSRIPAFRRFLAGPAPDLTADITRRTVAAKAPEPWINKVDR